jgi:hypothetical protein
MACTGEKRYRKGFGREITREEGKRPLRKPRYRWEINKNRAFCKTEGCGLD